MRRLRTALLAASVVTRIVAFPAVLAVARARARVVR